MHKISVCVPTYNRPDTLKQLINSYLKQNYDNKELVISDDSPDDSIKNLVASYNNKSIKYFHNKMSLRFARNLLMSMKRATGDYVVLLGDDDVFMNTKALTDYVNAFRKYKNAGFVYSNMIQFSPEMNIQYIITFTDKNRMFKKGEDSMKNMWIRSIYIGGYALRNTKNILRYYPSKKLLHPQVEFAGHILNNYDSVLLNNYNIGFRSHDDQLIFQALKNKEIQQEGSHVTQELFKMFDALRKRYHLSIDSDFLARDLIELQKVMMVKEKRNLGNKGMENYYREFQRLSKVARNSVKLKTFFWVTKLAPSSFLVLGRKTVFKLIKIKNRKDFDKYRKQLAFMIS